MSTGDVKFIGWVGGATPYKELAPQIQIEPSSLPGFVDKRVTINRICFDKDKHAVIGNLPVSNAVLSSVYLNASGTTESISLGSGYRLLSVSDVAISAGISRISAQYSKVTSGIFEVGLPDGFSIDSVNGICRIKYGTHILEEFDSGTTSSGGGLELKLIQDLAYVDQEIEPTINYSAFWVTKNTGQVHTITTDDGDIRYPVFADFLRESSEINPRLFKYATDLLGVRFQLFCNGVAFEAIDLLMGDIPGSIGKATERVVVDAVYQTNQDAENVGESFVNGGYSSYSISSIPTYYSDEGGRTAAPFTAYVLTVRNSLSYLHTPSVNKQLLYPRWESSGNTHRIMIGLKPWREYDVTGLA